MIHEYPVVITGIGTVNGLGLNCHTFWENLITGKSAVSAIQSFDSSAWRTHVACEIKEALPNERGLDRVYVMLNMAVQEAIRQSAISLPPERTGVSVGSLLGGMQSLELYLKAQIQSQNTINLQTKYPFFLMSGLSRFLASELKIHGPLSVSGIACAASGAAISRAVDLIQLGYADVMLAGGAETFCQITLAGFNAIRSAASSVCQPFSKDRGGLVIGEGAGVLVLESYKYAQARGAKPIALILGTGLAEDAYHITSPDPQGSGAVRSMRAALADAGLQPDQIDYVNAHGTGTPQNDRIETKALKIVFGENARQIPISSIKAAIGHCMGAAGAIEAVASILTLCNNMIPPTINFIAGDDDCDLDYVPNQARAKIVKTILSNSFGFGGNDASIIFGHPDLLIRNSNHA
jgi:3-oxoacyl-[acyl-carrier-protein] synthase II